MDFDFTKVLTPDQIPTLTFAIATLIGLVNAVQKTFPKVTGIYGVLLAVFLGVLAGFFNFFGMTIELGLIAGFASSGVYKLGQVVSGS
jgi:hypothetical protein